MDEYQNAVDAAVTAADDMADVWASTYDDRPGFGWIDAPVDALPGVVALTTTTPVCITAASRTEAGRMRVEIAANPPLDRVDSYAVRVQRTSTVVTLSAQAIQRSGFEVGDCPAAYARPGEIRLVDPERDPPPNGPRPDGGTDQS